MMAGQGISFTAFQHGSLDDIDGRAVMFDHVEVGGHKTSEAAVQVARDGQ